MKNILIIGAGLSAPAVIQYALDRAGELGWFITLADIDPEKARAQIADAHNARAVWLDVTKNNDRKDLLARTDLVVSVLPAHLHLELAHDCIKFNKPLITSAYISDEMYRLGDEARDRDLSFTGEMGLDPGLERMTFIKNLDDITSKGGKVKAIRSYAGGLVDLPLRENPWSFQLTWNPRNIVLSGQGMAQYLENGKLRCLPYPRLFKAGGLVRISGVGEYEYYVNRETLLNRERYNLSEVKNFLRGTLRPKGFCAAWDAIVQLGLTDADFPILHTDKLSYYDLLDGIVGDIPGTTLKDRVARFLNLPADSVILEQLKWLGLFSKRRIKATQATPAYLLEQLLREKWTLNPNYQDRVVIYHEMDYKVGEKNYTRKSTSIMQGDTRMTGMAKTVGLPMGIILKKLVLEELPSREGTDVCSLPEVYGPVLEELSSTGFSYQEVDEEH